MNIAHEIYSMQLLSWLEWMRDERALFWLKKKSQQRPQVQMRAVFVALVSKFQSVISVERTSTFRPERAGVDKIRQGDLLKIQLGVKLDPQVGKSSCERKTASFCSHLMQLSMSSPNGGRAGIQGLLTSMSCPCLGQVSNYWHNGLPRGREYWHFWWLGKGNRSHTWRTGPWAHWKGYRMVFASICKNASSAFIFCEREQWSIFSCEQRALRKFPPSGISLYWNVVLCQVIWLTPSKQDNRHKARQHDKSLLRFNHSQ